MQLKTTCLLMGAALLTACNGSPEPPETRPETPRQIVAGDGPGHALWQALRPHSGATWDSPCRGR